MVRVTGPGVTGIVAHPRGSGIGINLAGFSSVPRTMPIYLDHAATTPTGEAVVAAVAEAQRSAFGNASSRHAAGHRARRALEAARARVAASLCARPSEIVFVRGGTESDNLAVLGRARLATSPLVAVSAIEHPAVLEAAKAVSAAGGRAEFLRVAPDGSLDDQQFDDVLKRGPQVVSVMWVNNETGVRLPVPELAARSRALGVAFHTDAVQAVGKIPVNVSEVPVDLLTLSAHKFGGPTSSGALYVREGTELAPRLFGGGHERGLRPGTSDVASAIGLAVAIELAVAEREDRARRWSELKDRLVEGLSRVEPGLRVHGAEGDPAPHIVNVGIPMDEGEALLAGLDLEGLEVSGGSACSSGSQKASRVLTAFYGEDVRGRTAIRFSFGADTEEEDIEGAIAAFEVVLGRLKAEAR